MKPSEALKIAIDNYLIESSCQESGKSFFLCYAVSRARQAGKIPVETVSILRSRILYHLDGYPSVSAALLPEPETAELLVLGIQGIRYLLAEFIIRELEDEGL